MVRPTTSASRTRYVTHLDERDVYATPSHRWGDPRAQLLTGDRWEAVRPQILSGLGLTDPVHTHLQGLTMALDAGWRQLSDRLRESGDESCVRIVPTADGRMRLTVERLDALEVPESLVALRERTAAMLPRIDLPDLLLEVHAWTGFLDAYAHTSGAAPRMTGLPVTVAALLIAEACNVGLSPVIDSNNPALTRARPLGYPISDEITNPDGVGKRNSFQNGGDAIYWSPSTPASEVGGAIFQQWGSRNYETGHFGYPTSDEFNFEAGRAGNFQGGTID